MKPTTFLLAALLTITVTGGPVTATAEPGKLHVKGTFEVQVTPLEPDNPQAETAGLMRMALDKRFHGALDATAQGEMMASGDGTDSGAYVAIEKVEGTLNGRQGSFALVHMGIMKGPTPEYWSVKIIPDSGTDELEGIEGEMTIIINEDGHHYELSYKLPKPHNP